jgi:hypothetical protein
MKCEEEKNKLLNRFLLHGRSFVKCSCFQYGKMNTIISGEASDAYIDDFQYFVFTKSIKTLCSIKSLLKLGNVEDVLILLRTTFEGYLASRYIDEKYDRKLLNDFIFTPVQISMRKVIYKNRTARERYTNNLIEYIQRNPSKLKLGKDETYFSDLYGFFCNYAHCNYSIIPYYLDEHDQFTYEKNDNYDMVFTLVLFVYTKIFENIVTVEGEDFYSEREEKECYKLVKESTCFLYKELDKLSKYNSKDANDELNEHMKEMFKNMKESLEEQIGSLNKDFLQNK